jgi:hypothetical protein
MERPSKQAARGEEKFSITVVMEGILVMVIVMKMLIAAHIVR